MGSLVLQAVFSVPLVVALAVYVGMHRERGSRLLCTLLGAIAMWIAGVVLVSGASEPVARRVGFALLGPPTALLAPLFFLTMTRFARLHFFHEHRAADAAVFAPFLLYYGATLTNDWHGLVFLTSDAHALSRSPSQWAGPAWWAFRVCADAVTLGGLAIALRVLLRGQSYAERTRALLLITGVMLPLLSHAAYTYGWLSLAQPITPAAMGVTALLIATAIHRYELLQPRSLERRDVIEALGDGVLLADADGITVDANPVAGDILGRSQSQLRGLTLAQVLEPIAASPADRAHLQRLLHDAQQGERIGLVPIRTVEGRWLEVSAGTTGAGSPDTRGLFIVLRDRTRERRTEQQLHQSQRLESVGVLAAGVAHEVNNPLSYVRANLDYMGGTVDLLKQRADQIPEDLRPDIEEMRDVLSESSAGIERIAAIVASLLRFSRASSDDRQLQPLNPLVEEALRLASLQGRDGIDVQARLANDLPAVEVSSGAVVQVLLNLLLNAKQALRDRETGIVEVETALAADAVEIRVRDDGPGIPPDVIDHIFDPFFTTREPGEGTGLGLSIAYDIVQEHAGQLQVESPPGEGACFRLRLPLAEVEDDEPPVHAAPEGV